MHLNKNHCFGALGKRLQLSFLIFIASGSAWHGAHAAPIYQCKQAGGKVAFQEMPCAQGDAQAEVGTAVRAAPRPAAKARQTTSANVPESSDPATAEYAACRTAGVNAFDPSLSQDLQHPQAAFNRCKKALPAPMNRNGLCLDACVQSWVGEYKKKYHIGQGS